MSFVESGADDQSEDGELRHSPTDAKLRQEELLDFSLSEEDVDTADSLDIKPPQINKLARNSSRSKRRDRRENRTRHSRSERHREERTHLHREKHHRERGRTRPEYHREYKELYRYTEAHSSTTNPIVGKYVDVQFAQNVRYERKYDETKKHERYEKDMRYQQEPEKSRRFDDKHMRLKSVADQTLDDLRERLLDKKRLKDATEEYTKHHSEKESRRRLKIQEQLLETALEQDADMYVKEIIDLSEERKDKNKSDKDDDKKILDSGSEEHELRKEKLLQAEREMSRQKEQYKLDRERRHQRRQERQEAKRKMQEEQLKEEKRKRQRISGELSVVTVSDASSRSSKTSLESRGSSSDRSSTSEEEMGDRSDVETTSGDEKGNLEERKVDSEETDEELRKEEEEEDYKASPESLQLAKSDRSSSRSRFSSDFPQISSIFSRFRSKSLSPKSNGQINKIPEEKPKSPSPKKLDEDLPPYFPAIQGCRSVEEFQCLNRIEEGTYGVVYRARDKRTEEIVALKRLKMEKEKEGFPITSLREINTLLKGQHPNIVTVREIVVGSNMDKIFIVMDYVEHDLKSLMETMRSRRQVFVPAEVKCLLKQLLGAVGHLHDNWILHRDLKTSNLLLSHKGILKVGDFGLAREYGSPLKPYTPVVVTLWYRAPELLLCAKEYSTPVDLWSVGCIFAELLLMNAYFPGKSEVDQLNRIFKELGTPNDRVWPSWPSLPAVKKMKFTDFPASNLSTRFSMLSEAGLSLLKGLLAYDPTRRLTADSALRVPWFVEAPLPIEPALFPTWPARSEMGPRRALHSPKPPSGGRDYKQLGDNDEDSALGFHMGGIQSSALEARRLAMGAGFSLKF